MAKVKKEKETLKSQLDALNGEAQRELAAQAAPVAPTNYTGVKGVLGASPAYEAAYAAEKARLDAAVANGPLFAGQSGAVGEAVQRRAMERGLTPGVSQVPGTGAVLNPPAVEPVQPMQGVKESASDVVGEKVRASAMQNGLYGPETGEVGEKAKERAMSQGLFPAAEVPVQQEEVASAPETKGNWDDVFAPQRQRLADVEGEMADIQALDEQMQRREDARKRIVALGDAFASFANLIGTAHGAENQRQTYASPLVADTIDRSRSMRAGRMQQIRKNIDEQRDMLIKLQMNNNPDYLPNRQAQERIDVSRGNQQLQYDKLANTAANQAATQQLNRDKFEYQQDKDAAKQALDERKQDFNEWKGRQQVSQGWSRINLSNRQYEDKLAGRSGSGGNNGEWSKEANYNAFKQEVASRDNCENWEDFVKKHSSDADVRRFIENVEKQNGSPNGQKGILSSYAEQYAPEFFEKYYLKEQKQTSSKENKPVAPWAAKSSGSSSKAPWVK